MSIDCRRAGVLALAGLVLVLSSCGDGQRKKVYPARGRVVDAVGKPVAGATVVFHPLDDPDDSRHKPAGTTDAEGSYALTTYLEKDGAPLGEYAVTLEWRPVRRSLSEPEQPDRLQGKFREAKTSPYRASIKQGDNEIPPIQLP
jgi:hypothetical protein